MASNLPQVAFIRYWLRTRKSAFKGFTLTELLVSIVMGSILVGSLLYLVVELLGVNTREEVLTQTQQDMNRALDYINQDASEAVFVYADPTTITSQLDDLPTGSGATPVLAFWRLDPIDISALDCDSVPNDKKSECEALTVRHSMYTLVVYLQQTNTTNDIWEGPTRVIRYELPKYTSGGLSNLTVRPGYADPSLRTNSFDSWTKGSGTTSGNKAVLTDYVDAPNNNSNVNACPNNTDYTVTPATSDNFYVCVRTGDTPDPNNPDETVRTNQSLVVYLRGNATADRSSIFGPSSQASRLPTLESEVLIRGVIEKEPDFD